MPAKSRERSWADIDLNNRVQVLEFEKQLLDRAQQKLQHQLRRLQDLGIIDQFGNRRSPHLPPDMEEGSDRDFGG